MDYTDKGICKSIFASTIDIFPDTKYSNIFFQQPHPPASKYMMGLLELLGADDEQNDPYDDEREDPAGFTKDFLQRTSLHGLQ